VSALAAERLWPTEDPTGKQFRIGPRTLPLSQVLGDVHGVTLDRPPSPTVYVPYWQTIVPPGVNSIDLAIVARTTADPKNLSSSLRSVIRGLDPDPSTTRHTRRTSADASAGLAEVSHSATLLGSNRNGWIASKWNRTIVRGR
jgi:hypothetical protein